MHETAMKIISEGGEIYRINCDAITFTYPAQKNLNFNISKNVPGHFKHEYSFIFSLAQLGINTLSILSKDENGEDKCTMKVGGIQQCPELTAKLSHQSFVKLIESTIVKQMHSARLTVENIRKRKLNDSLHSIKVRSEFDVQMTSALQRRQLLEPVIPFRTYPFGFVRNGSHKHKNPFITDNK